jgi:hypothetical protein
MRQLSFMFHLENTLIIASTSDQRDIDFLGGYNHVAIHYGAKGEISRVKLAKEIDGRIKDWDDVYSETNPERMKEINRYVRKHMNKVN